LFTFKLLVEVVVFSDHFGNSLEFEPASIPARGLAYIIDRIILIFFWIFLINLIILLLSTEIGKYIYSNIFFDNETALKYPKTVEILVTIGSVICVFAGYITIFMPITLVEYFLKGRSPGKCIMGIRIDSTNGEAPSFMQIFIRSLFRDLEGALGFGIIFILATSQRQTFYDTITGTVVVKYRQNNAYPENYILKSLGQKKFMLPLSAQSRALSWQRYYKMIQRYGYQGESVQKYLATQAGRRLINEIPRMEKLLPKGKDPDTVRVQNEILRNFSDALDNNEVRWENR
jgi:uncharacterized RDD family membrane protein YckC